MTTYTQTQAQTRITQLVSQLQQNKATLLHTEESNIENIFVRPLFRYLNWNVDTGLAEPQWEFVLQRRKRIRSMNGSWEARGGSVSIIS